jgi:hypothetical protein
MNPTVKGSVKSKLMWLGLITTILGAVQANPDVLAPFLEAKYVGLFNMLVGVGIMVARFFTTQSIADKGSQ